MRLRFLLLSVIIACGVSQAGALQSSSSSPPASQGQPASPQEEKAAHRPVALNSIEIDFPDKARQKNLSGVCVVSMTVDVHGLPQDASILRCSDPVFEENSLKDAGKIRFKPATDEKGKAVPAKITIEVHFTLGEEIKPLLKYGFATPPGVTSFAPDAQGIYPLSKSMVAPSITSFVDAGFSDTALTIPNDVTCDVVITVSAKGKPSDAQVIHCDQKNLEKPATDSLLRSHFKPGMLDGKPVPVRLEVHLYYGGFVPRK